MTSSHVAFILFCLFVELWRKWFSLNLHHISFNLMSVHCLRKRREHITTGDSCLEQHKVNDQMQSETSWCCVQFDVWWHLLPFSMALLDCWIRRTWVRRAKKSTRCNTLEHILFSSFSAFGIRLDNRNANNICHIAYSIKQQLPAGGWWWNVSSSFFRSCLRRMFFKVGDLWEKFQKA